MMSDAKSNNSSFNNNGTDNATIKDRFLFLVPLLIACYPIVYFFNINAEFILITDLLIPGLIVIGCALLLTLFLILITRDHLISVLIASIVVFFSVTYGIFFSVLKQLDIFQIEHYAFMPCWILSMLYLSFLLATIKKFHLRSWLNIVLLVLVAFVSYNLFSGLFKQDWGKLFQGNVVQTSIEGQEEQGASTSPDIYYIVLDEFGDTAVISEIFQKEDELAQFKSKLQERNFFIFEQLSSRTASTTTEMASRLNIKAYDGPEQTRDIDYMISEINNAAVYDIFKQYGYKTAVYPGYYYLLKHSFTVPQIKADLVLSIDSKESNTLARQFVQFEVIPILLDYTLYNPFVVTSLENNNTYKQNWRNFALFAFNEIPNVKSKIDAPFFLYAHITAPHVPYVFDANGGIPDESCDKDAYCFYDQYVFVANQVIALVDRILAQYPEDRPPIIIVQSDHGFRNNVGDGWVSIPDYPEDYRKRIFFATNFPGYEVALAEEDFDPIDTFPILFNSLFETNIPVVSD